jgi:hypothetical protein
VTTDLLKKIRHLQKIASNRYPTDYVLAALIEQIVQQAELEARARAAN